MAHEGWSPERLERLARAEKTLKESKERFFAARGIVMAEFGREYNPEAAGRVRKLLGEDKPR